MKRIKNLSLGVVAAMALTASMAAASASATQFRAEEYPAMVSGAQVTSQIITTKAGSIKCAAHTTSGTMAGASSSLTVTPAPTGCKLAGINVPVNAKSCSYVFNSTNESAPYSGTMGVSCSKAGDAITIGTEGCQVTIPAQSALGAVEFVNSGSNRSRAITVNLNISGLEYTQTSACAGGSGTFAGGTFTGSSKITGYNSAAKHSIGVYLANEQVADTPQFEAESYAVIIAGEMTKTLELGVYSGIIKCSAMKVNGNLVGSASALKLSPLMSCNPSVSTNGCYLTFNAASSEFPNASGSFGIGCEKVGSVMEITFGTLACKVQIPAQANAGDLSLVNTGSGSLRGVNAAISGHLEYTEIGSSCVKPGTHVNGNVIGEFALKGFKSEAGQPGAQEGIWVE